MRLPVSEAARAVGPLIASIIILNAIGLALPLTAIGLLIVRYVGFEGHPEALNAYYAIKFAPSFMIAIFGVLSDTVDLRRGASQSRQARRGPWMFVGFCGAGLSLVLFALKLVTTPWQLYAAGLPGAFFAEMATTSIEGALVQRGISAAATATLKRVEAVDMSPPLDSVHVGITNPVDGVRVASVGSSSSVSSREDSRPGGTERPTPHVGSSRNSCNLNVSNSFLNNRGSDDRAGPLQSSIACGGRTHSTSLSKEAAVAVAAAGAGAAVRSAIAAVDYQLRGLGSLMGFLLAAVLPPDVAVWVAVVCYGCAALLAIRHGQESSCGRAGCLRESTLPETRPSQDRPCLPSVVLALAHALRRPRTEHNLTTRPVAPMRERGNSRTAQAAPAEHDVLFSIGCRPAQASEATPHQPASVSPHSGQAQRRRFGSLVVSLWRRWGGLTTLGCVLTAFIYQTPPTAEDTFDAFLYSTQLNIPASLLAVNSGLNLGVGMVLAAFIYERIAPPPILAICMGAVARSLSEVSRLLVLSPHSPGFSTGSVQHPTTVRLLLQTVLTSLGTGFGFLPIVALASVAAPARAEAATYALIITAQSAGTLVAAAIAAAMSVNMGVGQPGTQMELQNHSLPSFSLKSCETPHLALGTSCHLTVGLMRRGGGTSDDVSGTPLDSVALMMSTRDVTTHFSRSWDRLSDFIVACALSKLLVLTLVMPLLLWLRPRLRDAQLRSLQNADADATNSLACPHVSRPEISPCVSGLRAPLI